MADNTPSHDDEQGLVVKFKDGFEPPITNTQKAIADAFQNLTIPELPLSSAVDYSALEKMAVENEQWRQQKERQDNNRFWMNFWLSVAAFIVALLSLIIALR